MKKSLAIAVVSCFLLAGCSTNHTNDSKNNPPKLTVSVVSKSNLNDWNISLTPNLELKAEYVGSVPCETPVLHTSTGFTISTGSLKSHEDLRIGPKNDTSFKGEVQVRLSWKEHGKQMNGQETFRVE